AASWPSANARAAGRACRRSASSACAGSTVRAATTTRWSRRPTSACATTARHRSWCARRHEPTGARRMNFDPRRREALKAAALAAVAGGAGAAGFGRGGDAHAGMPAACVGVAAAASDGDAGARAWNALRLWYARPATQWVEALPLGNGRLGAMVWGGGKHERLQLNEDTLYAGGPYDPTPPDALEALPEVRRLLFARRFA